MDLLSKQPINRGWSGDRKYCAVDGNGVRYLLRISDIAKYETKRHEFNMMKKAAALGVPMCLPIEFGVCEEGVYSVQSWIDGEDAGDVIPGWSSAKQYRYGLEAGRILRRLHSIPAPAAPEDWEARFSRTTGHRLKKYAECPVRLKNGQLFIDCINENRHLLKNRPQVFLHGDYHIGNMMLDRDGKLHIIDFDRSDHGDPWAEFDRIVWCVHSSPHFARGMVNGYFDNSVPADFWSLLALYISSNTISSIHWAIPFGQDEVNTMLAQAEEVLSWYGDMSSLVPAWYREAQIKSEFFV